MAKRTLSAGLIGLATGIFLFYSGFPMVLQATAAALCCFCLYELAKATDTMKNEALFPLSLLGAVLFAFRGISGGAVAAEVCLAVSIPVFVLMMVFQPKLKLKNNTFNSIKSPGTNRQMRKGIGFTGQLPKMENIRV